MYLDGYKTLSHISVILYFEENYNKILTESQLKLIDHIRKNRNGIVYYGKKISDNFLINNRKDIIKIISILFEFTSKKLK